MTPFEKLLPPFDEEVFDLLADGELTDAQRRELLASLDACPDGWRRCALAFLESQCWKGEFGAIRRSAEARPAVSNGSTRLEASAAVVPTRPRVGLRRLGTPFAVAATFLIALIVGTQIRPGRIPEPGESRLTAGGERNSPAPALAGSASVTGSNPWKMVKLAGHGIPDQEIRLPAREGRQWDENWKSSTLPAIPDDVLSALEREGRRVRHSWQFVPVPLEDGRRLVVPVDQFDVHYPDYQ